MDIGLHQRANRSIDGAVARQQRLAAECFRHHDDSKVTAAIPRASMADMAMTLIDDAQFLRVECSPEC